MYIARSIRETPRDTWFSVLVFLHPQQQKVVNRHVLLIKTCIRPFFSVATVIFRQPLCYLNINENALQKIGHFSQYGTFDYSPSAAKKLHLYSDFLLHVLCCVRQVGSLAHTRAAKLLSGCLEGRNHKQSQARQSVYIYRSFFIADDKAVSTVISFSGHSTL